MKRHAIIYSICLKRLFAFKTPINRLARPLSYNSDSNPTFSLHSDKNMIGLESILVNRNLDQSKGVFNDLHFDIDTTDFSKIINDNIEFVDKSLFIKEVVNSSAHVSIILRPESWGKSTNMGMLNSFLSLAVDEGGDLLAINPNKSLFDELLIGKEYEIMSEHQGKYPVIFISFKALRCDDYQCFEDKIKNKFQNLYKQFEYLQHSEFLGNYDKNGFQKYLNGNIPDYNIYDGIYFLSRLLYQHHKKRVYILIDDYDIPLNYTNQRSEYILKSRLLESIYETALTGNNYLEKAILTGINKIPRGNILFGGFDNACEYTLFNHKYTEYFGFTENEVNQLLHKASIYDMSVKTALKEYYGGYTINGIALYNPKSIVKFF